MSIHSSLKGANTLVGERSVLTRKERIEKLKKSGRFTDEESSVFGLAKVRTKFKVVGRKKKAAKPEDAEGEAAAEAAPESGEAEKTSE